MNGFPDVLPAFIDLTSMNDTVFLVIRGVAAFVGAVIGWFLSSPLWRGLYRLAFQRPIPGGLLPLLRLGGAGLFAALVFFFLPLGGGGGWGWGPGGGGGPGTGRSGNGDGTTEDKKQTASDGQIITKAAPTKKTREKVDIEIISAEQFTPGTNKYYLLQRKEPARDLADVEAFCQDKMNNLEVHIIITNNSIGEGQGARGKLVDMLNNRNIYHSVSKEKEGEK